MTSACGVPSGRGRQRDDACPGALRLHSADDGALARVRVPGGLLTTAQATELALIADELGDGHLDLTSRGNVQLRGLPHDAGDVLAERLGRVGLLPSPAHERVRNIVASPLGPDTVRTLTRALDAALCADERAARLSGRFLFAIDDGSGDVAALRADITLVASPRDVTLYVADAPVRAVPVADAASCALRAAHAFLDLADAAGEGVRAWRVRDLDPDGTLLGGQASGPPLPHGTPPAFGLTGGALSVGFPLGRASTAQWRALAGAASGEIRLTPWRGAVLPGIADDRVRAGLAAAGFVTADDSPWHGATACAGRPGCAKSLADVRDDARTALAAATGPQPLPVHWSGCERRCGHPGGTRVEVTAAPDGYRVTVHSAEGAPRTITGLTGDRTSAVVAAARATTQTGLT
ncbi:cobalamin biosynthesis protein CobG [Streptantibioticus parmotrematis]|uniref:cobalamin biosynthesis protein CobG n=1 Tax=Streptantibioticus parmotrematis TaxID=2873249 RepID=UPI0033C866B9